MFLLCRRDHASHSGPRELLENAIDRGHQCLLAGAVFGLGQFLRERMRTGLGLRIFCRVLLCLLGTCPVGLQILHFRDELLVVERFVRLRLILQGAELR